jgi:membrane-bound lytic murein transglycosylase B
LNKSWVSIAIKGKSGDYLTKLVLIGKSRMVMHGIKKYVTPVVFMLGLLSFANSVHADEALLKKKAAQAFVQDMVKKHGFKREDVELSLKESAYQPRIVDSMNRPYEKKDWDAYSAIFLTPERLKGGLAFWQANQETLAKAEARFGVPASVIVAILGVETKYGKMQGNYRVLDALSTLAFYYPKRAPYFTRELEEYLLLCREHKVPATTYVGSYAGAMGQPQFMPSNYRVYAVNAGEAGHPDLIHENNDVILSVANYFKRHGWHQGGEVVEPAVVEGKDFEALKTNGRKANYAYDYLVKLGVHPVKVLEHPPEKAGLIEVNLADHKQGYWVAYPNFYVITRYNTSPQYALVVHLLSEQLEQHFKATEALKSKT